MKIKFRKKTNIFCALLLLLIPVYSFSVEINEHVYLDESFGDGGYIKIPVNDKRISDLCITKETRETKSKHIWVLVGCNGLRILKLSKSGNY